MTDWRQIQARIRKAKNSPDAQLKLSELFQRTHDAMVAWELGGVEEKASRTEEAVKWYTVAAERFRRPDWKKKAQEALGKLGVSVPEPAQLKPVVEENTESFRIPGPQETHLTPVLALGEIPEPEPAVPVLSLAAVPSASVGADGQGDKRKRRRGRRGGRGRNRKGTIAAAPSLPPQAFAESVEVQAPKLHVVEARAEFVERPVVAPPTPEPVRAPRLEQPPAQLLSERMAHGRPGDPALASRMAHLESMLRRLVSSPLHRVDETDLAPAGPGVLLLSDSDLVSAYYIEACQTLRVALGNLSRGGRGAKSNRGGRGYSDSGLKQKLAEHLGISESKVGQYLKDHCVVRWIQLDDDAPFLASFAIGVLRTPLNLD